MTMTGHPDPAGSPARTAPQGVRQSAFKRRFRFARGEAEKLRRYGLGFPRAGEAITVEVAAIERAIVHPLELGLTREESGFDGLRDGFFAAREARGRVIGADAYAGFAPVGLDALVKLRCCIAHWGDGVSWEATGIYELLMQKIGQTGVAQSGCRSIDDVRAR